MMTYMVESHPMADRQREFARQMRAEPTDAERVLWQRLRHDIALTGSHFRRKYLSARSSWISPVERRSS
jgi:very-short-patch-repair endonuclease